jgi:hypothetical protein
MLKTGKDNAADRKEGRTVRMATLQAGVVIPRGRQTMPRTDPSALEADATILSFDWRP